VEFDSELVGPASPDRYEEEVVSVIIVSWNVRDLLLSSLASLGAAPAGMQCQAIVVDNGSTDGSPDAVRESFPDVEVIANRRNLGFAAAANQGLRRARGAWVLLLNPDAQIDGPSLRAMVEFIGSCPQAGVAGAALVDPGGQSQPWGHRFPSLLNMFFFLSRLEVVHPGRGLSRNIVPSAFDDADAVEVDWVTGACLLARREILESLGGLDEDYFIFGEDVDLCYRARQNRWRVYYLPQVRVVHRQGSSTRQVPGALEVEVFRGHLLFFRKHRNLVQRVLLSLMLVLEIAVKTPFVFLLLISPGRREYAQNRLSRYAGTLAAIAGRHPRRSVRGPA
jgi:GT2 family glycosyltransferase